MKWMPGTTPGSITVQAGAQIASGSDGYTLLAAPNVSNAGSIIAVDGQVMLAAVIGMRQGTVVQNIDTNQLPVSFDLFQPNFGTNLSKIGTLDNTGLVSSTRGDATLVGYDVRQDGIVTATTSISRPGSVTLLAIDQNGNSSNGTGFLNRYLGGVLDIGPGSITSVLPDDDGETTTSSQSATLTFQPPSMTLLGAQVGFDDNSLVLAPGATLNIIGWGANPTPAPGRDPVLTNRIWMDTGSIIDVAGLPDVDLPMSSNLIEIPIVGQNELANSPLQRDGFLYRSPIVFDRRDTGVLENGQSWIGSPLLNAQGYVDEVPRTIDQMLTNGGAVNVSGRDFVMNQGASIDLDGGFLHYEAGMVQTQRLVGSDGRLYDLADADPSMTYVGFAGQQTIYHSRWGVNQTFASPLLGTSLYYESDYIQGGNAGTLNIDLGRDDEPRRSDPESRRARAGRQFVGAGSVGALPDPVRQSCPRRRAQSGYEQRAPERLHRSVQGRAAQLGNHGADRGRRCPMDSASTRRSHRCLPADSRRLDPGNPGFWSVLSTAQVASGGFAKVAIGSAGLLTSDAGSDLQVADGGSITINAGRIDLQGSLTAHAGTINLQSAGGEVYANVPVLQTGGAGCARAPRQGRHRARRGCASRRQRSLGQRQQRPDGPAKRQSQYQWRQHLPEHAAEQSFIVRGRHTPTMPPARSCSHPERSSTHPAAATSMPLASSRPAATACRSATEETSRWRRICAANNDSLVDPTYVVNLPARDDQTGLLQFQGASLLDFGFAGGGTLSLRALGVQIGGVAPTDPRILYLAPGFFDSQGFGGYNLAAELDATITVGTDVRVSQLDLLPDVDALRTATTGTDILAGLGSAGHNAYVARGQLDDYHRPATNFSLSAGDYLGRFKGNPTLLPATGTLLLDEGASLTLDAGADVRLGSRGQVTVLGDITDHGGSVTLSGDSSDQSGLSPANPNDTRSWFDPGKSVWLGADSRLDVSGIALINPLLAQQATGEGLVQPRNGVVLDGGTITLTNDTGYVVVQKGAQLDLSGTQDAFDLPTDAGQLGSGTSTLQRTPVWSDGGTLTLAASAGLYFDGTIHAAGGNAQARGGELDLLPLATPANAFFGGVAATGIVFTQSDSRMPEGLTPGARVEAGTGGPSGTLFFAADRLNGSGIDTLIVGNQNPDGGPTEPPLVPIGFSGDVDLSVASALVFKAPLYALLPDGGSDFGALGSDNHVHLGAAYVGLDGFQPVHRRHVAAEASRSQARPPWTWMPSFIDIGGQVALSGVGTASFDSSGDIRFNTPAQFAFENVRQSDRSRSRASC